MELKNILGIVILIFAAVGCGEEQKSDAYGRFEADEITVSAEASGILQEFNVEEGEVLKAKTKVGQIDTTQLALRREELKASIKSIQTNINSLDAQANVYEEQLTTARKNLERYVSLQKENAATQQQIDQAVGQVNMLEKQIVSVDVQKQSVYAELEVMESKIKQLEDQIERAQITNPVEGRVLNTFVESHELVARGTPLYEIANLQELDLRVYISGAQLPKVTLGQEIEVFVDKNAEENKQLQGRVIWIASEAEFTPKMIQTKEERVTQVYAVKIRVPNENEMLKIGMPGEVKFN